MANPIATYSEIRFTQKRSFALFADSIEAHGKSFNAQFETKVPLALLNPIPDKVWMRSANFGNGISLCVLAVILVFVVAIVLSDVIELPALAKFATLSFSAIIGIAGILMVALNWRKVEWARFKNSSGVVILDIANIGNGSTNFDEFIELLTKQISAQKSVQQPTKE